MDRQRCQNSKGERSNFEFWILDYELKNGEKAILNFVC